MILKVCAVYDKAIEAYMNPFVVQAVGAATRSFSDEVNREGSPFNSHPGDYDLYLVGEFDDSSAILVACTPPRRLALGSDLVNRGE